MRYSVLGISDSMVFFFFSSRRRHTRFDCDWSSDVCSSDLTGPAGGVTVSGANQYRVFNVLGGRTVNISNLTIANGGGIKNSGVLTVTNSRSEERRVGKECRSRWSPYH